MSNLKINVASKIPPFKKGTAFVIGVEESSKGIRLTKHSTDTSTLSKHDLSQLGASSTAESLTRVAAPNGAIFSLIGIGSTSPATNSSGKQSMTFNQDSSRALGGSIARNLKDIDELVIDFAGLAKP